MPKLQHLFLALTMCCLVIGVRAADAPDAAADPVLEKRTLAIAAELRCLVCQNQTIADSNADLAVDLRQQVRQMLRQGQNQEQILAYMTERYGDFVLYRPPVNASTALLWFGPPLLLLLAAFTLWRVLRNRSRLPADRFEAEEDRALDEPSTPDKGPAGSGASR